METHSIIIEVDGISDTFEFESQLGRDYVIKRLNKILATMDDIKVNGEWTTGAEYGHHMLGV